MDSVNGHAPTHNIEKLMETLECTAYIVPNNDRMFDHYLNKEIEMEILKLREDLYRSKKDSSKRYEVDAINHFLNTTRKNFHDSSDSLSEYRRTSTPKLEKKTYHDVNDEDKGFSFVNSDITEPPNYLNAPKSKDHGQQIHYHLERINDQVKADRSEWKIHREMKNVCHETRTLHEEMEETTLDSLSISFKDVNINMGTNKRKILEQQASIQFLTGKLEKESRKSRASQSVANDNLPKCEEIKLLEEKLNEEEDERMKIMKDYTDIQQLYCEADEERSQLLFTLTDLKTEARAILHAYEEASQCIPEMKLLLEQSAKQKVEFSDQIKKMQSETEEYKNIIAKLAEKITHYEAINKEIELEKENLNKKNEEIQSKCNVTEKELRTTNQLLLEVKSSFSDMEVSREQLKVNALNTLKSYRSKCEEYEKQIENSVERYKTKEIELSNSLAQIEELEIENIRKKQENQVLSNKLEELQEDIINTVKTSHQLSDEKNQLESQLNETIREHKPILDEREELKNENTILQSELQDEKQWRLSFENVCNDHNQSIVSLKQENSALRLTAEKQINELQKGRDDYTHVISELKEQYKIGAENDMQSFTKTKEALTKQLEESVEKSRKDKKMYEDVQRALEQQKMETEKEIEKSAVLLQTWRTLASKNQNTRKVFQMGKREFDTKTIEYSGLINQEHMLQEQIDNIEKVSVTNVGHFKTIMIIITEDIENLQNLLWYEQENTNPIKELPEDISPVNQIEIVNLREKLHSCFSITKTLKERYNKQKLLITRARERIKSQMIVIHQLKSSQNENNIKQEEKIFAFETTQRNNEVLISTMKSEKNKLQNHINDLTEDLEVCTRALYKSVQLAKESEIKLHNFGILNVEHKGEHRINENAVGASAKMFTGELKETISHNEEDRMNRGNYAACMVETFHSVNPSEKNIVYKNDSPYYQSCKKCLMNDQSFMAK